ncbi:hypothetical protein Fmac_006544 [Flemingia macrophylla]|uniref:Uncharacterized protein n=1 Tax=Flemingia macrophylla TaxID=520843 RepID=A0ABD1NAW9_9FABA
MYVDLSTMFDSKSAISSTSTFIVPTFTALILFSFTVHSEYSAVDASFFPRNPSLSRRLTNAGIAPDRPIAALLSSACESRSSQVLLAAVSARRGVEEPRQRMPGSEGAVEECGVQVRSVLLLRVLVRHVSVRPRGGGCSLARNLLRDEASAARGGADAPGRSRSAESRHGGGFRDGSSEFDVGMDFQVVVLGGGVSNKLLPLVSQVPNGNAPIQTYFDAFVFY